MFLIQLFILLFIADVEPKYIKNKSEIYICICCRKLYFFLMLLNPNSIRVKYSLIVWGRGEDRPCLCFALPIGKKLVFYYFELKIYEFFMTKAVSNKDII